MATREEIRLQFPEGDKPFAVYNDAGNIVPKLYRGREADRGPASFRSVDGALRAIRDDLTDDFVPPYPVLVQIVEGSLLLEPITWEQAAEEEEFVVVERLCDGMDEPSGYYGDERLFTSIGEAVQWALDAESQIPGVETELRPYRVVPEEARETVIPLLNTASIGRR